MTDLPVDAAKSRLSSMVEAMTHEAWYTTGAYCLPEIGCYIGWADQRGEGSDALTCRQGDRVLILAGEHFSSTQRGRGDLSRILSAYDREDERCLRGLSGWFAGVLIDPRREKILIFNDRFGLHRLYYTTTSETFAFASEAKALLAIRPESRRLDLEGLGQFFALGCQIGERTLFEDVSRMPGGAAWTVGKGREVRPRRYFTPSELEQLPILTETEYYDRLKQILTASVPRYMAAPGPVAVSLTGGFDTRAIMAFDDQRSERRSSYTYGGMYRDCLDVQRARNVAAVCGYEHQVLALDQSFLNRFAEYAQKTVWVTEGTLDVSASHEIYLSRLARAIAPVRMTGNYGSEVLRGVSLFRPLGLPRQMFAPEFVPYIEAAEASLESARKMHPATFAIFEEIPSSLYGRLAAAESQLVVRTPFMDNELVAIAYQAPPGRASMKECWTRLIAEQRPALSAIPTDRGELGTASAVASLPSRLYNHLLFKAEWYYEGGMPDWLSPIDARLTRGRRPPFFAGVHKIQHYRLWFRDHLADWVDSVLGDSAATRPYLNRRYVRGLSASHRTGRRNCASEISALATIELLHRSFFDSHSGAKTSQRAAVAETLQSQPC
jgi:asparagine synthase (glutamine-hydrolysing)